MFSITGQICKQQYAMMLPVLRQYINCSTLYLPCPIFTWQYFISTTDCWISSCDTILPVLCKLPASHRQYVARSVQDPSAEWASSSPLCRIALGSSTFPTGKGQTPLGTSTRASYPVCWPGSRDLQCPQTPAVWHLLQRSPTCKCPRSSNHGVQCQPFT